MGHMFESVMQVKTANAPGLEDVGITPDQVKALKKLLLTGEASNIPVVARTYLSDISSHLKTLNHSVKDSKLLKLIRDNLGYRALLDLESGSKIIPEEIVEKMKKMSPSGTNFKGYILGAVTPAGGKSGTGLATIAHELGHASMAMKGLAGKLRRATYAIGFPAALRPEFGGAVAAATAAMDPEGNAIYAPTLALAALQAPVLFEEGLASKKAIGALKQLAKANLVKPNEVSHAAGELFSAWKSYAKPTAKHLAIPAAILAAKKGYHEYENSKTWYDRLVDSVAALA